MHTPFYGIYAIMSVTTIRTVYVHELRVYDANKPETLQGGESQDLHDTENRLRGLNIKYIKPICCGPQC